MLRYSTLLTLAVSVLASSSLAAGLIDFETTPAGATPADDAALLSTTPYSMGGVDISFGLDTNSDGSIDTNMAFEQVGTFAGEAPDAGFAGSGGLDTPDVGFESQLGDWFLRGPVGASDFGLFVIQYTSALTITAASGEIWDIDGNPNSDPPRTEEYTVRAYDAAGNLLATEVSPLGTLSTMTAPLDGRPWTFSFSGLSAGIDRIEVDFTGTKTSGIGLAFNNFHPTQAAVPEPTSVVILATGFAVLIGWRARTGSGE